MMFKDEDDLLIPWWVYHGNLFGFENLYVWDNGSHSEVVTQSLERLRARGTKVDRSRQTANDFHLKGIILKTKIDELEQQESYDFYVPIDCDEFFCIRAGDTDEIVCDKREINDLIANLKEPGIYHVGFNYPNILFEPGRFFGWEHNKCFFSKRAIQYLDHGFHEPTGLRNVPKFSTNFAYMHFHYKPLEIQKKHSYNKMTPYFDLTQGLGSVPKEHRLGRFLHMSDDEYQNLFRDMAGNCRYTAPCLREILKSYGQEIPFRDNGHSFVP